MNTSVSKGERKVGWHVFGLEIEDVGWWGRKEGPQDTEKWKELGEDFAGTEI